MRVIIILVRQRETPLEKGSEGMDEMTENQTHRLIEWLRAKGLSDTEIVECLEYIDKKG